MQSQIQKKQDEKSSSDSSSEKEEEPKTAIPDEISPERVVEEQNEEENTEKPNEESAKKPEEKAEVGEEVEMSEGGTKPEKEDGESTKVDVKEDSQKGEEVVRKVSTSEAEDNLIEVEDPDDYLLYLENILLKIHSRFYDMYEKTSEIPDLKVLIPRIRSEVLVGSNIVFSGLVPSRMRLEHSKAFQIARSLGANVTQDLNEDTTHLVAAASGTHKVNTARKRGEVRIVSPDWLWSCAERWEHVDERVFPLDPNNPSKMRQPPPHCHSPEHVVSYGDKADSSSESEQPKFMDTINPLLSFSKSDLAEMNKEFDQFFDSDADDSSSSDDSVDMENPPEKKSVRKRRRQEELEESRKRIEEEKMRIAFEANEESVDVDNTENSTEEDDEMPSTKFRRGRRCQQENEMNIADLFLFQVETCHRIWTLVPIMEVREVKVMMKTMEIGI